MYLHSVTVVKAAWYGKPDGVNTVPRWHISTVLRDIRAPFANTLWKDYSVVIV